MIKKFLPFILLVVIISSFFAPFIFKNKLPIPADTIVGLYNPFRDLYAKDYPNGIPFKNFLITDPVRQQYPWRNLSVEIEKNLQLPLWNSYNFSGTPLIANLQSAAFYPLNILFFLLPFSAGWSILIFLQPILAGFFLYLYLDNLKLTKSASFLGAVSFAFCGFTTAWLEWGTIIHTALWLPLILLCIDKLFLNVTNWENSKFKIQNSKLQLKNKKLIIWGIIFTFSLTSAFLAGHLQTFFYLSLVSVAYFFVRWWQFGRSKKTLVFFVICFLFFVITTSVEWFPSLQFILLSARNVDQNWQQAGWFIPWQNLIQFIAPDFFGNPTTLNYWGVWNYAEFVGYIGILPFLMALSTLVYRRDKKTLFFGLIFLLSLIFSLPTVFAQIPYILQIPFLSSTQPTRLLYLTDFSLSVLSGLGLDLYLKSKEKKKMLIPLSFMGIIFAALWSFVLFGYRYILPISASNVLVAKHNLYFPTILFFLVCVLILVYSGIKNNKFRNIVLIILLAVSVFDLFRFSQKFTPFTDRAYLFPQTSTIDYLQKQTGQFRIMTTDDRILPPNFSIMYRLQTLDGYDPLYLLRYGELMVAVKRNKPDIKPPFGFNRIITPREMDSRLIDLLGVKFILSLSDIKSEKLQKVFQEGQTRVYKNNQAYDRVFFVNNVQSVSDKNDAISKMFDPNIDFKRTAIVEDWNGTQKGFANGSASVVQYREDNVVISTQSSNEAFLVLMDAFYPTWHARICSENGNNCQETKIYLTNYNFRGVVVPAGRHQIQFIDSIL